MSISPSKAHDRAVKGNAALSRSFVDQANGDLELAGRLRSEWYSEMGRRSGSKRRALAAARRAARRAALDREAAALGITATEADLLRLAQGKR
jgi:hypothetical protein